MSEILKILGNNVRTIREAHGESQKELAKIACVNANTISYYENGQRNMPYETLEKIANHYSTTVGELLTEVQHEIDDLDVKVTWDDIKQMTDKLYPFVSADRLPQNERFKVATEKYSLICDNTDAQAAWDDLEEVSDMYSDMRKVKNHEPEITVNNLGLLFRFFVPLGIMSEKMLEESVKFYEGTGDFNGLLKSYDERSDGLIPEKERIEYRKELRKEIIDCISELSFHPKWSQLAYYYMGLSYVMNIFDDNLSFTESAKIGRTMMFSFAMIGNHYAYNYLMEIDNLF